MWGSSESSFIPQLVSEPGEFEYCLFDPKISGARFVKAGAELLDEHGTPTPLWEMVLTTTPESAPFSFWAHATGLLTADSKPTDSAGLETEVRVGDLWIPHPNPDKARFSWRFAGRTDDLITFSTGTNLYPVPMQTALGASPAVQEALVFGAGRLQPIVLIELAEKGAAQQDDGEEGLATALWEGIIRVQNRRMPTYGRIDRDHVLLVPPGGFVRTAKGTARRKETERKYAAEMEQIYQRFGDRWRGSRDRYGSVVVERSFSLSASSEAAGSDV